MAPSLRARLLRAIAATVVVASLACAKRQPPTADAPPPPAPDLTGTTVMLLPAQAGRGIVPEGLDAELAYWLADRNPGVRWILPQEIDQALARSPGLGIDPRSLPVSIFFRAEVRRVGDPLFGDLRRLGALVDARFALIPVGAGYVPNPEGSSGRVEVAGALIDTLRGTVLWFGIAGGEPGDAGASAVVATAAQAFAQSLIP